MPRVAADGRFSRIVSHIRRLAGGLRVVLGNDMGTISMSDGLQERGLRARRHNQALVALARRVWSEDCTLGTALSLICETAAATLEVERVNIWRLDHVRHSLHCVHAYTRSVGQHNPPGFEEVLELGPVYTSALDEVRVLDFGDSAPGSMSDALDAYRRRHSICSLLDAPVRSMGDLIGVICHEQVGAPRDWLPEDLAFAGSIGDYVALAHEIDRRREIERRLRFLERHDPQTQLPNRDHLLEVAHSALGTAHDATRNMVVIHLRLELPEAPALDLPTHQALVTEAAARLRDGIGDLATIARVREGAFAVIPHRQVDEVESFECAERCVSLLQGLAPGEGLPAIAVSAGIAFSRDLAAPSADTLLRNAEEASLRARDGGLNRCEVFDADRHRGLLERLRTEQALRAAFEAGELEVHYMPEVDLDTGAWRAAEALLRWRKADGRLIAAGEFIEVAEKSGLIVRLGRWVLRQACTDAAAWPLDSEGHPPMVRVNVSLRQFEDPALAADVEAALKASGLEPSRLCLELTETAMLRDSASVARTLQRLRDLGVRIALDDFGIGYCSLAYLKQLPIDTIKVDRGFVSGLPDVVEDLAIVESLALLARRLGIDVIGEGIETPAQADSLRAIGIHGGQGFLYSRAVPQDEVVAGFRR